MNTIYRCWLGRSLAIALLLAAAPSAIAETTPINTPNQPDTSQPTGDALVPEPLETTVWYLTRYRTEAGTEVAALSDRPATLQFQDGRVAGTTGCNRFFMNYRQTNETLSISGGGSTLMACFPAALAQQEAAILKGLTQVASYTQSENQLRLFDQQNTLLFTLAAEPEAVSSTAELTNTEWTLVALQGDRDGLIAPLADTTITAIFDGEGSLSGSAGCNTYRAPYDLANNVLTVGPAASTRRFCGEPDGIMQQEDTFLRVLQEVATYTLSNEQLDLKDATGTTLAQFVMSE